MKKYICYLLLIIIFIGNADNLYYIKNEKIYYKKNKNNVIIDSEITSADKETFEIIDNVYAKDKYSAFYMGNRISMSNPIQFKVINDDISIDDNAVYFKGEDGFINGVDVSSFKMINDHYIKDKKGYYGLYETKYNSDGIKSISISEKKMVINSPIEEIPEKIEAEYFYSKNNIYYQGRKIENVHIPSFEMMDYKFSKDRNNVYFKGEKIKEIAVSKFLNLEKNYFTDGKYIYAVIDDNNQPLSSVKYKQLIKIENISLKTFKVLDEDYFSDKYGIYYKGVAIKGADGTSFKILNEGYSEDRNSIYIGTEKIENVDKETFKILNRFYSMDKNNIYYNGKKMETFIEKPELINEFLIKIGNNIYFGKNKVKTAEKIRIINDNFILMDDLVFIYDFDGSTEEFLKINNSDTFKNIGYNYYTDGKDFYYFNEKLENTESLNFQLIDKYYLQVGKNIYFKNKKLKEADYSTFEVLNGYYAKDKERVYYNRCYNNYRYECLEEFEYTEIEKNNYGENGIPLPPKENTVKISYTPEIIKTSDIETFKVSKIDSKKAEDSKNKYFEGEIQKK